LHRNALENRKDTLPTTNNVLVIIIKDRMSRTDRKYKQDPIKNISAAPQAKKLIKKSPAFYLMLFHQSASFLFKIENRARL